ncbi:MAG TPA: rod shape-determining protein [bacterium]|nr:rod shape-determining protein [bacterium]
MFKNLLGKFSYDLGIDLGTSNTSVYVKSKGIVVNEPSVVAINNKNQQIVAIGEEAKKMIGKNPAHISVVRPLMDGIVSDFEVTEKTLKYFVDRVHRESFLSAPRPRVVIGVPLDITEVERKAVEDAALSAGAREVYIIEEPLAAAIGARLPITEAIGNMIIDFGGGTTEIAVISLSGVVSSKSLKIAGSELDWDIINYVREKYNLFVGENSAENIKHYIGSAYPLAEKMVMEIRGRDLYTGLPRAIKITDEEIRYALSKTINIIVDNIKSTVENTPPDLVSEIYERGMVLCGGGAQLKGIERLILNETKIPTKIIDDPATAVVRGTGIVLEDIEKMKDLLINISKE